MASCCCGHLLAFSISLASFSRFFSALCSLISGTSLSPRTLSIKAQTSSTRCFKASDELSVDWTEKVWPNPLFVPGPLHLIRNQNNWYLSCFSTNFVMTNFVCCFSWSFCFVFIYFWWTSMYGSNVPFLVLPRAQPAKFFVIFNLLLVCFHVANNSLKRKWIKLN